jgi:thymidine kinase
MAELTYYCGTMDSGKSTLALQTAHNHQSRGRTGRIFTNQDRAGVGVISSRLGLQSAAIEVTPELDIHRFVVDQLSIGSRVDYIICDEAQFYEPIQIDQLARIVDGLGIDVYAFGILADFRTKLFPGSARLVELADRVNTLQVEALCWCGQRATHNARTINGIMVTEGEQVVVGDTNKADEVAYEVLCRRHHMRQLTARVSRAGHTSGDPLPFNS